MNNITHLQHPFTGEIYEVGTAVDKLETQNLKTKNKQLVSAINEIVDTLGVQKNLYTGRDINFTIQRDTAGSVFELNTLPEGTFSFHAHSTVTTEQEQFKTCALVICTQKLSVQFVQDFRNFTNYIVEICSVNSTFSVPKNGVVYLVTADPYFLDEKLYLHPDSTSDFASDNITGTISQIFIIKTDTPINSLMPEIVYLHQLINSLDSRLRTVENKVKS